MARDNTVPLPDHVEILVIGAGVAGLTAARSLAAAGRDVLVVDKGWNPGGRMATRVTARARFDHGATFFYAAGGSFGSDLEGWRREGAIAAWSGLEDGEVHWRGTPDMRSLASHLARGLRIATRTRLSALGREGSRWAAVLEEGGMITADAVLMTPPVPQALEILAAGDFQPAPDVHAHLRKIPYERCFVLMAELDGPSRVSVPGFVAPNEGILVRVVDEQAKGTSEVPALTFHASPGFSLAQWESDRERVASEILLAAEPWLGSGILAHQIHGWRFSRPVTTWPEPCLVLTDAPPLILAGDAFGGPDLPGAHRSGLAAAAVLADMASR